MEIAGIGETKPERNQPKNAPKRGRRRRPARSGDDEEPPSERPETGAESTGEGGHIDVVA